MAPGRAGMWLSVILVFGCAGTMLPLAHGADSSRVGTDFDGDGKSDYGVYVGGIWDTVYSTYGPVQFYFGTPDYLPFVGRFNGDSVADVGIYDPQTGQLYGFIQGGGLLTDSLPTGGVPVVGDFDGDGSEDYGVYVNGLWTIEYSTYGRVQFYFGDAQYKPFVGNFNGDHLADVGIYAPGTGNVYLFVQGTGLRTDMMASAGTPVVGDFDGDGSDDYGVYVDGRWTVEYSHYGRVEFSFGTPEYIPFVGDFNGDRFADVGIYNSTDGQVHRFTQTVGLSSSVLVHDGTPLTPGGTVWVPPSPSVRETFMAMGNGITAGSGPTVGDPWPERLGDLLQRNVYNNGKPGSRVVEYGVTHVAGFLDAFDPGYLLILYGSNDVTYGYDIQAIINALAYMIDTAQSRNVLTVVATLPPVFGIDSYTQSRYAELNSRIRALASEKQCGLADVAAAFGGRQDLILDDGIHPTPAGQHLIATTFQQTINAM